MTLAESLGECLDEAGLSNEVVDMSDFSASELGAESIVLVVTSTYGNGDPPYNARGLLEALRKDDMPRLGNLKFAVFGLGDSTYPNFCQCGRDFDKRLEELGAHRIFDRCDCDGEPEELFEEWQDKIVSVLRDHCSD